MRLRKTFARTATGSTLTCGFTLLELLIVLAILGMTATAALLVVADAQDTQRYEATRAEYLEIKTALFGPESIALNGAPLVSGYLADLGALPAVLEDLRTRPAGVSEYAAIGPIAKGVALYHGWRGPYLNQTATDLRDPWGTLWHYDNPGSSASGLLELGSLGRDGTLGGTGAAGSAAQYDADFPPNLGLAAFFYTPASVTVPVLKLIQAGATPRTVHLGFIRAGLDLSDAFADHASLARDSLGTVVAVTIPAVGGEVDIPAGLTSTLGLARQFQVAVYDATASGTTLQDKLIAAHPQIFTVLPRAAFVAPLLNPSPWEVP